MRLFSKLAAPAAALTLGLSSPAEAGNKGDHVIHGLQSTLAKQVGLCDLDEEKFLKFNPEGPRSAYLACNDHDQQTSVSVRESFGTLPPFNAADLRISFDDYTDPDLLGDRRSFTSRNDDYHHRGTLYLDRKGKKCWAATLEKPRITRIPYADCSRAYAMAIGHLTEHNPEIGAAFDQEVEAYTEVPNGKGFADSLRAEQERIDRFCWGADTVDYYHELENLHGQHVMNTRFAGDGLACAVSVVTMADGVSRLVQVTSGDQSGAPSISVSFNNDGKYMVNMAGNSGSDFMILERRNGSCSAYDNASFMFGRRHAAGDCDYMLGETLSTISAYLDRTLPIEEGDPAAEVKAKMKKEIEDLSPSKN